MKATLFAFCAALATAAVLAIAPAEAHAPRCDATHDGLRHQSRVACYKSCKPLRIRAYCNSWCDRHCKR